MNGINYSKAATILKRYRRLYYTEFLGRKAITNGYVLYVVDAFNLQEYMSFFGTTEKTELCKHELPKTDVENIEPLQDTRLYRKNAMCTIRLLKKADGRITFVNDMFLRPFDNEVTFWQDPKSTRSEIVAKYGNEFIGIICSLHPDDDIRRYNEKRAKSKSEV